MKKTLFTQIMLGFAAISTMSACSGFNPAAVLAPDFGADSRTGLGASATRQASRQVLVNDEALSLNQIQQLESQYQLKIADGSYWYDKQAGIWGKQGGPGLGITLPNLQIGGALKADASAGNTGIFINGRQLHTQDVMYLQSLTGYVQPGRYWLDAYGNAGFEGGAAMVNLYQLARKSSKGGDNFWHSNNSETSGNQDSDGHGYVSGKGWSVSY
ncbi:MAG: hypothetical protein ACAI44_07940 [Candidatus Sericytochromatia bacterium]